ncbi:glycoside hydrolase superfamily [Aspergillus cavernicola]|uniref:Glycoside hydrolase superfamily n=1 Tax=Aspergillus cavernicola TaxID=176166 RepID=A0ABR4HKM0_9EURO
MFTMGGAVFPLLAIAGLATAATPYAPQTPPLTTDWTEGLGTNPWPEYPRPQLQRSQWQSLNGIWEYRNAESSGAIGAPPFGQELDTEVMIPSCLESGLSGLQGQNTLYSWLSTNFTVDDDWDGQSILLNFGAVDYEASVFINGQNVGLHRGGYFEFSVDATEYINFGADNELLVFVHDPTDGEGAVIPIGKQTLNQRHIFYRPCSGIWQSVWLEAAPADHISRLDLTADMDGEVTVTVHSASGNATSVEVTVEEGDETIASETGTANSEFKFTVPDIQRWSPDSPSLYNVTVTLGDDQVRSYTGFRTISKGTVDGVVRPLVNGEFRFIFGTLDQGYWPDGLYTPPNREAMTYDLQLLKDLGFNMVRKHIKVEPALFYRACDELGLLVIQDMPSLAVQPNAAQQLEFVRQLELLVNQLKNYPSIMSWVIYNEGWGQILTTYPEFDLTERVRELDPTRLVNSVTGWYDHGAGDYSDNHHYANPQCGTPFYSTPSSPYDPERIGIQGEFGGIGHNVTIENLWNVQATISTIPETYEIGSSIEVWNYRSRVLLQELRDQIQRFACSAAVWTQTTDVEGEVNGLMTYDRRLKRVDERQWREDIEGLYSAARGRVG